MTTEDITNRVNQLGKAWEQFKAVNDRRLREIEEKPMTTETLEQKLKKCGWIEAKGKCIPVTASIAYTDENDKYYYKIGDTPQHNREKILADMVQAAVENLEIFKSSHSSCYNAFAGNSIASDALETINELSDGL